MSQPIDVGSFIAILSINGVRFHVDLSHWDEIDAAYGHWTERRVDRVLSLTCIDGCPLLLAASRIGELFQSTPDTRARSRTLDQSLKQESGFVT